MRDEDFDSWLDKLAVLSMEGGESTTVHVLYVDQKRYELIVEVLSSNRPYPGSERRAFVIPFGRILSVSPAPAGLHPRHVQLTDPCRDHYAAFDRIGLFGPIILLLVPGSFFLFVFLGDVAFGTQIASIVVYTAAVILMTFSAQKGQQPYMFTCPIVQRQLHRLAKRHLAFLAAFFVLETVVLGLRRHLPYNWLVGNHGDMPPFTIALYVLGGAFWAIQSLTNRSLLKQAHLEFSPADSENM